MTGPGGTGADRPAFDPRHDARFQRGYQGADAARAPERRELIGPPPANPATATAGPGDAFDDFDTVAFGGEAFTDELESLRWNPFITLLWVIGVVLPAGGMLLQWQAVGGMFRNTSYSGNGEPPVSVVLQQFSYLVAPPLISGGIVILGGLLFWHAWVWQARRRRSAPSL